VKTKRGGIYVINYQTFRQGQRVRHSNHGNGTVILQEISDLTVNFDVRPEGWPKELTVSAQNCRSIEGIQVENEVQHRVYSRPKGVSEDLQIVSDIMSRDTAIDYRNKKRATGMFSAAEVVREEIKRTVIVDSDIKMSNEERLQICRQALEQSHKDLKILKRYRTTVPLIALTIEAKMMKTVDDIDKLEVFIANVEAAMSIGVDPSGGGVFAVDKS
jgi:ribosomal protein L28